MLQRLSSSLVKHKGKILSKYIDDNTQGLFSLSATRLGAVPDGITDNTSLIQSILDSNEGGIVYLTIEPNVLWHYLKVNMRNGVNIIDYSGWDDRYNQWNQHIKYHFNHNVDNIQHNGNTFHLLGRHHPALIIDNNGKPDDPEGEENRASVIFRRNGKLSSRVGIGRYANDTDFLISDDELSARYLVANTNKTDYEQAWNGSYVRNVDFHYASHPRNVSGTMTIRKRGGTGITRIIDQTFMGGKEVYSLLVKDDSSTSIGLNGVSVGGLTPNGGLLHRRNILNGTVALLANQSGSVINNIDATGDVTATLPVGNNTVIGVTFEFHAFGDNALWVRCREGDTLQGDLPSIKLPKGITKVVCYAQNKWYYI